MHFILHGPTADNKNRDRVMKVLILLTDLERDFIDFLPSRNRVLRYGAMELLLATTSLLDVYCSQSSRGTMPLTDRKNDEIG